MRKLASLAALLAACSSSSRQHSDVEGGTGLSGQVQVTFDDVGMPHIAAASEGDAAFALGWIHARDRFFQMDLFRRAARGTLGEVLGEGARPNDALIRTLFTMAAPVNGSYRIEAGIVAAMSPELRALGERYRDGVNRWLDDARAGRSGQSLPAQYALLGVPAAEVAAWQVEDSIAIGRLQSFLLSATTEEEVAAGLLAAAALQTPSLLPLVSDLLRHKPATDAQTLPPPSSVPPLAATSVASAPGASWLAASRGSLAGARAFLRSTLPLVPRGARAGSNNWAVSKAMSATGNALVANDPHLSLASPANFHLAHLILPDHSVAGVVFPGTPVVVIGANDQVAWGDTVVGYDVTDLYVEQATFAGTPPVPTAVQFQASTVPVTVIDEPWKVRRDGVLVDGSPIVVRLVPHHGPILPGSENPVAGSAITVRWTGQAVSHELEAFRLLNRARSVADAIEAVKSFQVGAQNFVFGDSAGNIGYYPHARVPVRTNLALLATQGAGPWLPMPGDLGAFEWSGDVPDAELPQLAPQQTGYVATANNDIDGSLQVVPSGQADAFPGIDPHYWYGYSDIGFRERRIQQLLTAKATHTLDDMTAYQADSVSLLAAATVPAIVTQVTAASASLSADEGAALALLSAWTGGADRYSTPTGLAGTSPDGAAAASDHASQAAALFHAFFGKFLQRVLGDELALLGLTSADLVTDQMVQQLTKIFVPLVNGDATQLATGTSLCDDVSTAAVETCPEQVVAAFRDAVTFLRTRLDPAPASWRWGRIHQVAFTPSFPVPLIPGYGPFANDGGLYTVDVANFSPWETTFTQGSGANVRFAAELAPGGVKFRAILPGGQSAQPGDPHAADQLPLWLGNGNPGAARGDRPFSPAEVQAAATSRMTFGP